MTQGKICPFCHQENPPHVERCERCGRPLPATRNQFTTTEQIAKTEPELTGFLPPVEHLGDLAKNTLVLFVNGEDEPILLEDVEEVILGRPMLERPAERTLDLTKYGAITLGVSRRHLRITYANGAFTVLDLGSTNGTSLNGRFLPPLYSQQLRPFDQITLGQLRLMVYFVVNAREQGKSLLLTDNGATKSWSLTPDYLTFTVMPYIQALADIQKIIREVRGQPVEEIQILYVQLGERPAQIRLKLLMAEEATDIVRQWIGPWRHIHTNPGLLTAESYKDLVMPEIRDLVALIADHLVISLSELETFPLREKLFGPVSFIATSDLELTLEAPRP